MSCQGAFRQAFLTDLDEKRIEFPFESCDYCGSLTIADTIQAFKTPGTRWSGADWKYSWPHKLYVDVQHPPIYMCKSSTYDHGKTTYEKGNRTTFNGKFYTTHLERATIEEWIAWTEFVEPVVGIHFEMKPDGLFYSAPTSGYQDYGVIVEPRRSKRDL